MDDKSLCESCGWEGNPYAWAPNTCPVCLDHLTESSGRRKWIWELPVTCDNCKTTLERVFVDTYTKDGKWMNLCLDCHAIMGTGYGPGRGQRYNINTRMKEVG